MEKYLHYVSNTAPTVHIGSGISITEVSIVNGSQAREGSHVSLSWVQLLHDIVGVGKTKLPAGGYRRERYWCQQLNLYDGCGEQMRTED